MRKHLQPLTPAALYARVSSDRQDVDLSVAAQNRALRDIVGARRSTTTRSEHISRPVSPGLSGRRASEPPSMPVAGSPPLPCWLL